MEDQYEQDPIELISTRDIYNQCTIVRPYVFVQDG